jgi:hypothetical protein
VREVYITKANGVKEIFKPDKLSQSLLNSGASEDIARGIVEHISRELQDGMSTSVIYDHAFYLLGKKAKPLAARYSLRRALGELGPSGFPFEKFMINEKESFFTREIFLPAFIDVMKRTGSKPIIVALEPTEIETDEFWMCHPHSSKELVNNTLKEVVVIK